VPVTLKIDVLVKLVFLRAFQTHGSVERPVTTSSIPSVNLYLPVSTMLTAAWDIWNA